VTLETDNICAPCPHRRGPLCDKQSKIESLDHAHAKALNLSKGNEITWKEAKTRLASLSLEDHQRICQGCSWLDYGLCAQALQNLKNSST
jgi:hypothetical protein